MRALADVTGRPARHPPARWRPAPTDNRPPPSSAGPGGSPAVGNRCRTWLLKSPYGEHRSAFDKERYRSRAYSMCRVISGDLWTANRPRAPSRLHRSLPLLFAPPGARCMCRPDHVVAAVAFTAAGGRLFLRR
jgi:hypothetical protein